MSLLSSCSCSIPSLQKQNRGKSWSLSCVSQFTPPPCWHVSYLQLVNSFSILDLFSSLLNTSKYFGMSSHTVQPHTQMLFALYCRDEKLDIHLNVLISVHVSESSDKYGRNKFSLLLCNFSPLHLISVNVKHDVRHQSGRSSRILHVTVVSRSRSNEIICKYLIYYSEKEKTRIRISSIDIKQQQNKRNEEPNWHVVHAL